MKSFLKFTLASILGFVLGIFVLFFILAGIAGIAASSFQSKGDVDVKTNSLLVAELDYQIMERDRSLDFGNIGFLNGEVDQSIGILQLHQSFEDAAADSKIKGVLLNLTVIPNGWATNQEVRKAILKFRESGKFVWVYSENYFNNNYYIASAADKVYMYPEGLFILTGMSAERTHLKGMLDKLEIETKLIRPQDNSYKSAGETFQRKDMSEANKEQTLAYLSSIHGEWLNAISDSRGIEASTLKELENTLGLKYPQDAIDNKLVDGLIHWDELLQMAKDELGVDEADDLESVTLVDYASTVKALGKYNKEQIAVVYANGGIAGGEGDDDNIGSDRIARAIREARRDEKIKAIVLRVNSPGGSALASDVILREMKLAKAVKPTVVSMGNVAASGGYFIAAHADRIFAQPTTITGSIGVFSLMPNTQTFFENKLGITFDRVKTGEHGDILNPNRPVNPKEEAFMQTYVDMVYEDFTGLVADGRNLDLATVKALARGRVYTGLQAKELGLVDEIGGLKEAIAYVASKAELESYQIKEYPKLKNPFEELMEVFGKNMSGTSVLEKNFAREFKALNNAKEALTGDPVLMRMEYDLEIQ